VTTPTNQTEITFLNERGAGIQVYGNARNLSSTVGSGVAPAQSSNFMGMSGLQPLYVNVDSDTHRESE